MKPLPIAVLALTAWLLLALLLLGAHRVMVWIDGDAPHPVAANATVERRLHLVMESKYDSDKPKKYECREVKP